MDCLNRKKEKLHQAMDCRPFLEANQKMYRETNKNVEIRTKMIKNLLILLLRRTKKYTSMTILLLEFGVYITYRFYTFVSYQMLIMNVD